MQLFFLIAVAASFSTRRDGARLRRQPAEEAPPQEEAPPDAGSAAGSADGSAGGSAGGSADGGADGSDAGSAAGSDAGSAAGSGDAMNETVMWEPQEDQVLRSAADSILDNLEKNENCDDAECDAKTIEICEKLWKAKLEVCVEKAEEWAYICPAPTYLSCDHEGVCTQRNCKKGCCSAAGQGVIDGTAAHDVVEEAVPDVPASVVEDIKEDLKNVADKKKKDDKNEGSAAADDAAADASADSAAADASADSAGSMFLATK